MQGDWKITLRVTLQSPKNDGSRNYFSDLITSQPPWIDLL
jgi:hypothetical protein